MSAELLQQLIRNAETDLRIAKANVNAALLDDAFLPRDLLLSAQIHLDLLQARARDAAAIIAQALQPVQEGPMVDVSELDEPAPEPSPASADVVGVHPNLRRPAAPDPEALAAEKVPSESAT